jgi:uncharacterized membrane protein YagU involved in acid resistance
VLGLAARGALGGLVGTWVMDLVTTALYEAQAPEVTAREQAARPNGKPSVDNMLDRLASGACLDLTEEQRKQLTSVIHYGLGVVPGMLYALAGRRLPLVAARNGLLYGFLLWALNDELLNSTLGFAGPFEAYPLETHWRGLAGHLVLGLVTDAAV